MLHSYAPTWWFRTLSVLMIISSLPFSCVVALLFAFYLSGEKKHEQLYCEGHACSCENFMLPVTADPHSLSFLQKKKEKNRIIDPDEEKCNCVGPPDPISNLRVIKYYVPSDETQLERRYRLAQQATHEFNQKFWADHNEKFKKMKAAFIKMKLNKKYGDCEKDKKTLSADEMSQFYKSFLDDHRLTHKQYNNEWYKRNINNLVLATRVWLEQTLKTRRR